MGVLSAAAENRRLVKKRTAVKLKASDYVGLPNNPGAHCYSGTTGWWFNWCARSLLNRKKKAVWNAETDAGIKDVVNSRMLLKLD